MERKQEVTWSRWKPSKRQREILEELYKDGHRNPSRDSINDFTNRLKRHGNVEAKNVFYWFQNTHARNKKKQKKETPKMQQSPVERTHQTPSKKYIVESSEGQTRSSPTKADRVDSSMEMAQLSTEEHPNSPESATSTSTQKLLPIDVSVKRYLQPVGNETFFQPDHGANFRNMCYNAAATNDGWVYHFTDPRRINAIAAKEYEKKHELLELFPLHSDGNLRSNCGSGGFHGHKEIKIVGREKGEWLSLKFEP